MQRTTKQLLYGSGYLVFWLALGIGIYTFNTQLVSPTCTDGIKNQEEEQADCGGSCQSCAIKLLVPVRFGSLSVAPLEGGAVALLELQNANAAFGAQLLSYDVSFYDASGGEIYVSHEETFIYPSEVKSRVLIGLPAAVASAADVRATTTLVRWIAADQFSAPRVQLREVETTLMPTKSRETVQGIVKNDNAFGLSRVVLEAVITNEDGSVASASKTVVQDLIPGEERHFQIILPLPEGAPRAVRQPRLSTEAQR